MFWECQAGAPKGYEYLRQTDLVSIFGARRRVSEVVNGKRAISKAQA
jgi:antitoxin component HigA of HigAB toxin-antitoxin module